MQPHWQHPILPAQPTHLLFSPQVPAPIETYHVSNEAGLGTSLLNQYAAAPTPSTQTYYYANGLHGMALQAPAAM